MAATDYGRDSLWKDTAAIDADTARDLAGRLEKRGASPDEIAARSAYLDLLGIRPGDRVLDAGCGSGVVTREVAQRVGAGGRVVGVDPSAALLTIAREIADRGDVADRIEFRVGSALALPFADAAFDRAIAVTVLGHIPNGAAAIPELVRVVRAGGTVGAFDFDSDMTAFTHPDRDMTRRIVGAASDAIAVDGWMARRTPLLLAKAGVRDVQVRAFFPIDSAAGSFYVELAERSASAAVASGAVSAEEAAAWLGQFRAQLPLGPVVAGRLHVFAWGTKG
jgi:SAM-dependent methyltransferase